MLINATLCKRQVNFSLLICSAALLFGIYLHGANLSAAEQRTLTIGFLPYISPSELVEKYTPLANYLGKQLGRTGRVVVAKDYATHIQNLKEKNIDIAFLGAATYVKTIENGGPIRLLARYEFNGQPFLHSLILVRQDSPLKNLADLRGKRMAFGDSNSTLSHYVPRAMLTDHGIDVADLAEHGFIGNHENVVQNILFGRYDAGAIADEVFSAFKDKPLRILAESSPYSGHVFVAGRHVSQADAEKISALMLNLKFSVEGQAVIQAIGAPITGFTVAHDADYDPMRKVFAKLRAVGVKP